MSDFENIRVALRIRPLVKSERDRGCQEAVERIAGAEQVHINRSERFTFNYVFDAKDTQETVYNMSVSGMLDKLFDGFNATILAYGQTGSGKTHTMGTAFNGQTDADVGVIPRAMNDIFERIEKLTGEYEFVVSCSYMELYQEQLYDLLTTAERDQSVVEMRENGSGIIMPGLTEIQVRSARETTDCLLRGSSGRAVASTAMNEASSRSHAIFTVTLQATKQDEIKTLTTSKFHLVDLAGSERSKKTQATGDRFKEGVKINQGLSALGNVISALGSTDGSGFVRYRDSKLTRLLQDSLGGNSITLMIACISPADYNVPETLSTLRYADRAKKIKNKPIVNQDPHAAEIIHLKGIIQKLRMELLASGGGMSQSLTAALQNVVVPAIASSSVEHTKMLQQLQVKYRNLQHQFQMTLHDVAENEMRAHIAEASNEQLKVKMHEMKRIVCNLARDFTTETTTPEKLQEHIKSVQQIRQLVDGLDEELERTQSEMSEHKRSCAMDNRDNHDDDDDDGDGFGSDMHALMQEKTDAFTDKQIDFKDQLRRINRELNLKEQLHQRVAGNLSKFRTLDDNMDEKFKECETKIQELEAEKAELMDKLKHVKVNPSAKLAEERRKRLQTLEQEIGEMKRKNTHQSKLLKVREKESQKIHTLHTEIQAMKESKVKLIRSMRQESELFRQWKMTREKELVQLKNKDRKMQNEMVRKEALHTKQRNVLKRKCEEALAINKRLKEALDRQKVAQSEREKQQSVKAASTANTKIEQVISWVERQLEVIISLVDAEYSLEQLMEDRGVISSRIGELQSSQSAPGSPDSSAAQELVTLAEELPLRNAQIADLQQKVCAADIETLISTSFDTIHSLAEARAVLKHLLKTIMDMRREHACYSQEQRTAFEEQRAMCDFAEEQCAMAAKRIRQMSLEHEEAMAEREDTYEEKIAVLLRELHTPQLAAGTITPEQQARLKIQEEQLNKIDRLREELDSYKQLVEQLQQKAEQANLLKVPMPFEEIVISDSDNEYSDFELIDSVDVDPDWRKTPLFRRSRTSHQHRNNSDLSSNTDANTSKASRGCRCRGNCVNQRCGCHSNDEKCTMSCRCNDDTCSNGKVLKDQQDHNEDGDNPVPEIANEDTPKTQTLSNDCPKLCPGLQNNNDVSRIARISKILFSTPAAKKKFFQ